MTTGERFPLRPFLYMDQDLDSYMGVLKADAGAIADLPPKYGMTLEQIGIKAILFSTYATDYDAETATLTLGVLDETAPSNVVNPTRQHRDTLAHRSVPASNRPKEYFAKRSEELSCALAGIILERAVETGYRSREMQNLQDGRKLARGGVHVLAVLAAATGLYYANRMGFFDTPVGTAMPLGGLAFVVGLDRMASYESRRQEDEDLRSLTERQVLEVEGTARTDLVHIVPPGPVHTPTPKRKRFPPARSRRYAAKQSA